MNQAQAILVTQEGFSSALPVIVNRISSSSKRGYNRSLMWTIAKWHCYWHKVFHPDWQQGIADARMFSNTLYSTIKLSNRSFSGQEYSGTFVTSMRSVSEDAWKKTKSSIGEYLGK